MDFKGLSATPFTIIVLKPVMAGYVFLNIAIRAHQLERFDVNIWPIYSLGNSMPRFTNAIDARRYFPARFHQASSQSIISERSIPEFFPPVFPFPALPHFFYPHLQTK